MPVTATYGIISAFEAYNLDQLGKLFNHDRRWAQDTFVRPVDRKTRARLIDRRTGEPVPGVPHYRAGWDIIVTGESLIRWLSEHGNIAMDDDEEAGEAKVGQRKRKANARGDLHSDEQRAAGGVS